MSDLELSVAALQVLLRESAAVVLLDVRNAQDYGAQPQRIPGALKLDAEASPAWLPSLPPERPIVVYCQHGQRLSTLALEALRAKGFTARKLTGGMDAWREAGGELTGT